MPNVNFSQRDRMQVRAQDPHVFQVPDVYALFGGRVAVAFFTLGFVSGYLAFAVGLALA